MKAYRWNMEQEIFNDMQGNVLFTGLDFFTGYWEFLMDLCCLDMMTLVCKDGKYAFQVIQFVLMKALSTYQLAMDALLKDLPLERVYLDDVVIFPKKHRENLNYIRPCWIGSPLIILS